MKRNYAEVKKTTRHMSQDYQHRTKGLI